MVLGCDLPAENVWNVETLAEVDRLGWPLGLKRSEIVRRALRDWIRRQAVERFEQEWIAAAAPRPARF